MTIRLRALNLFLVIVITFALSACTYIEDYIPTIAPIETRVTVVSTTLPTDTPTPTLAFTPTPAAPTATPTPAFTPTPTVPPKPYALQPGAVIALPAFTHPEAG